MGHVDKFQLSQKLFKLIGTGEVEFLALYAVYFPLLCGDTAFGILIWELPLLFLHNPMLYIQHACELLLQGLGKGGNSRHSPGSLASKLAHCDSLDRKHWIVQEHIRVSVSQDTNNLSQGEDKHSRLNRQLDFLEIFF